MTEVVEVVLVTGLFRTSWMIDALLVFSCESVCMGGGRKKRNP